MCSVPFIHLLPENSCREISAFEVAVVIVKGFLGSLRPLVAPWSCFVCEWVKFLFISYTRAHCLTNGVTVFQRSTGGGIARMYSMWQCGREVRQEHCKLVNMDVKNAELKKYLF